MPSWKKKKAAAVRRDDQIDAELAELDARELAVPPSAVESYVANMGHFLGMLGYEVTDQTRQLIASSQNWMKGAGVELLAAFGPAALLSLLARFDQHKALKPQSQPQRGSQRTAQWLPTHAERHEAAPTISNIDDPEIDAFFDRRIDTVQGEFITASVLFQAWQADCAEHGVEPGSQKAFSRRIQRRVGYDRNSGRPKYCHVRLRSREHASLRLAVNNAS